MKNHNDSTASRSVDSGCPDCGQDIDKLGGNPDCPTCAGEPKAFGPCPNCGDTSDVACPDCATYGAHDSRCDHYAFHTGDRVRFVVDTYHGSAISAGTLGTIHYNLNSGGLPYISRVTHATSNGGGHDVPVLLDDGRKVSIRVEGRYTYIERI